MSLVQKLMKETGADEKSAKYLLEACSNNYKMAVLMYQDSQPAQSTSSEAREEDVRAPIPRKFEVLCPEPGMSSSHNLRNWATWHDSSDNIPFRNTMHMRDFEQETRHQEEMMGLGRGIFGAGSSRGSHVAGTSSGSSSSSGSHSLGGEADLQSKLKKLEDLFKPPLDLIYKGSFFMAREEGKEKGKWLLANIQDNNDFMCHTLNRDVWSNANVRKLLDGTFLLWQAAHDSEHGRKYMNFYPSVTFPYIAIIDSRTGEHMSTFTETDPKAFCKFLKNFISLHGRMPSNLQFAADFASPEAGKRKTPDSDVSNGHDSSALSKLSRSSQASDVSSSRSKASGLSERGLEAQSLREVSQSAVKRKALFDITEEAQMELAIAASLKTCQSNSSDAEDNDDLLSLNSSLDDDQEINYSFEDNNATTSEAVASSHSPDKNETGNRPCDKSCDAGSGSRISEWRTAKNHLVNGAPVTVGSSKDDSIKTLGESEKDDSESWRRLAAEYDNSDSAAIVLRLPDGKRETINLPRAAPLTVLRRYLRPRGYSPPGYRAFTGWPKIDVFELDESISLKDAGLSQRDTIILQKE